MSLVLFLLAAAPAAQVPAVPPPDPLAPLYYLIGSMVVLQLGAMIFGGIRWLMGRTVEREDKDKEDLRSRLTDHDDKFREQERVLSDLNHLLSSIQQEAKSHHGTVVEIRGAIAEIKGSVEQGRDKQAEAHRSQMKDVLSTVNEKLEALEFQLRQDTTRAIHDANAMQRARTKK